MGREALGRGRVGGVAIGAAATPAARASAIEEKKSRVSLVAAPGRGHARAQRGGREPSRRRLDRDGSPRGAGRGTHRRERWKRRRAPQAAAAHPPPLTPPLPLLPRPQIRAPCSARAATHRRCPSPSTTSTSKHRDACVSRHGWRACSERGAGARRASPRGDPAPPAAPSSAAPGRGGPGAGETSGVRGSAAPAATLPAPVSAAGGWPGRLAPPRRAPSTHLQLFFSRGGFRKGDAVSPNHTFG